MPGPNDPLTAPLTNPNPNRQAINPNQAPTPTLIDRAAGALPPAPGIPTTATPTPTTQTQVPTAQNIDPNANINPNTQPTQQQTQPQANPIGAPQGANGTYTVQQITAASDAEVLQAQQNATAIWAQIQPLQQQASSLQNELQQTPDPIKQQTLTAITNNLNNLYNNYSVAETTLAQAQQRRADSLTTAQKNGIVDPAQADLLAAETDKAGKDANYASVQADVLKNGAQGARDLVAAQAGYQNALAAASKQTAPAQADYYNGLANQAQAQADTIAKQGGVYVAQAQQIQDLISPQSDLMKAQAAANTASSRLSEAQAADVSAKTQAGVGLLGGQTAAQYGAGAQAASVAGTNLLGPLYGLQDRLQAIRDIHDQFFGPGSGLTPEDATKQANSAMQDYFQSSVAGTTPYAASVAAANAGLTQFGTQASMYNAAQSALASRANALAGLGGNVLSTLGTMNANAPAGSTAMAAAFKNVMDYALAQQGQAAQQAAQQFGGPVQQPSAPALPPLLQKLAGVGGGAPTAGAPAPAGGMPMPAVNPAPVVPGQPNPAGPATGGQPGQGQGVQINVSTGGSQNATTASAPGAGAGPMSAQSIPGLNIGAMPGAGPSGNQSTPLPAMLQKSMPLNNQQATDYVHQLWGNELGAGSVQSPYASMGQPTPYVGG